MLPIRDVGIFVGETMNDRGLERPTVRRVATLVGVGLMLIIAVFGLGMGPGRAAAAVPIAGDAFTAEQIVAAFQGAGLPVDRLRQQPTGASGPTGPPAGEREAWAFSVASVAPSGGRLLLFTDVRLLEKKAAWYRQSGAGGAVITYKNVLLWLDPGIDARDAARYRSALREVR